MEWLLSTDFDGTLINFPPAPQVCVADLGEALVEAVGAGAVWVVNTGRSLEHTLQGLREFGGPLEPEYLVVNERHVFVRSRKGWEGLEPWNARCDEVHQGLMRDSGGLLDELRRWIVAGGRVRLLPEGAELPEGLVAQDEAAMEEVARFLDGMRREWPEFSYQRNAIYLRFCHRDYDKGSALRALRDLLGLGAGAVLAAGDNHNDLSMLEPQTAGMCVCPANAVPEVLCAVRKAGGYVARRAFGSGTAEGIRHFLERLG